MIRRKIENSNWSPDFRYCRKCHETTHRHVFDGYCKRCYHAMEKKIITQEKKRSCLKCGETFLSNGPGNRKCKDCHNKENNSRHTEKHRYRVSIL